MDWREKIWYSDAARANPTAAQRLIEEAGGTMEGLIPPGPAPEPSASSQDGDSGDG